MVPLRIWIAVMLGGVALAGGIAGIAANVRLGLVKHERLASSDEVALQSLYTAAAGASVDLASGCCETIWVRDQGDGHLAYKFLVTIDGAGSRFYYVTMVRSDWQVLNVTPGESP